MAKTINLPSEFNLSELVQLNEELSLLISTSDLPPEATEVIRRINYDVSCEITKYLKNVNLLKS